MRRPSIIAWVGLAIGITAASGRLEIWLAALIATGFAWIASESGRPKALILVLLMFTFGYSPMLNRQTIPRMEMPLRVVAVGYVDRYSALSEEKLVFHVVGHLSSDESEQGQEVIRLPETFAAVFKPLEQMKIGGYYRLTMTLNSASLPRNPGMFNYRQFLDSRGIAYQGEVVGAEALDHSPHRVASFREKVRQRILDVLLNRLGAEEGQLAAAMILGDTADLDPELLEIYRQTGTAHILAVSGLHFGILFTGAEILLERTKLPYILRKLSLVVLLLLFLGLVGLRSSAMRAAGMLILAGGLQTLGRQYDRLSGLALTGMGILVFRPVLLFDVGYQMSMAAVFGIAVVLPVLAKPDRKGNPVKGFLNALALSFSVLVATALPAAWHFNTLSLISVIVNLPVVFLTGLALPLAFLTLPLSPLPVLPALTGWMSSQGLRLIEAVVRFAEGMTAHPSIPAATPGVFKSAGVAAILIVLAMRKSRREFFDYGRVRILGSIGLLALILFGLPFEAWLQPVDRIRFFDVGQGDAALIQTRAGENILIDSGDGRAFREMDQLLLKSGVSTLSLMVLTHPHMDHIGGAEAVLERLKVGSLVLSGAVRPESYGSLTEVASRRGVEIFYVHTGDRIGLKGSHLEVLSPPEDAVDMGANEASIVMTYVTGELSFLFTGDITARQEYAIIDRIPSLKTILKVAHHGSKTSSSEAFISALKPGMAVISVGRNSFGHPGRITLDTLFENKFITYRTDLSGCIEVKTDGESVWSRQWLKN
ncbi:DNA internalization-related competence protein ComEC/Rec2 [Acidaminobacter sp.]|uniref:DNA internalization-related competence protein ComEC/Rec2 n=1 Tax=Acidaminobacter sp. TaxID=1872102 RepID=UPI0025655116|nr:DNA internalization-related competence protein ComEC/Rec2 [Acidaminobacter sp.]MDK9709749.1 DNA internalization-related competence protein ComEC/Rec2 [Acidaminobacter sp.]